MKTAERKAKRKQRTALFHRQYDLHRIHCKYCPEDKILLDPDKKCGGCAIYGELLGIGKALSK